MFLALVIAAMFFSAGASRVEGASARCLDQAEIRDAVASGRASPLDGFLPELHTLGDVVAAEMCEREGRLVYILTLVSTDNQIQRLVLDAERPAGFGNTPESSLVE